MNKNIIINKKINNGDYFMRIYYTILEKVYNGGISITAVKRKSFVNQEFRARVMYWVLNVVSVKEFSTDIYSLFKCMHIYDTFVSNYNIKREELELIAITIICIIAQVQNNNLLSVDNFIKIISKNKYNTSHIITTQIVIANTISYNYYNYDIVEIYDIFLINFINYNNFLNNYYITKLLLLLKYNNVVFVKKIKQIGDYLLFILYNNHNINNFNPIEISFVILIVSLGIIINLKQKIITKIYNNIKTEITNNIINYLKYLTIYFDTNCISELLLILKINLSKTYFNENNNNLLTLINKI